MADETRRALRSVQKRGTVLCGHNVEGHNKETASSTLSSSGVAFRSTKAFIFLLIKLFKNMTH